MKRSVGDIYNEFQFTKIKPIDDLNCTLIELKHQRLGSNVIHIESDDQENLFCLSFPTLPYNSNGVAHILEHTVLCGSKRFPVRDPFFSMHRRSLNTFMNALTGSDFTCYPASSQVEIDFYNLFDVYLDAIFHPLLTKESFLQEGHRVEFKEVDNADSHLIYKGIVFNEMKGSMASADSRLWHGLLENLLPDLPYAFNSGGEPTEIPNLTYQQLLDFHKHFYHPSHCLFYFYGNIPIEKHLDFLTEKIPLNAFEKVEPLPLVQKQKRFSMPKSKSMKYPTHDEDLSKKTYIGFAWLTTDLFNQDDLLALILLDSILMDTDASLLKHRLITSGLCVQADAYIDPDMGEIPYLLICRGTEKENEDALEELILASLKEIAREGIEEKLVLGAIHQLELSCLEITGGRTPYGLILFMRSALAKQHGADTENALRIHTHFKRLIEKTKDPKYLSNLIQKYFIDNSHRLRLTISPDPDLERQELEEEGEKLKALRESLSEQEKKDIIKQSHSLKAFQEQCENQSIDCLPKIDSREIPKSVMNFPLQHSQLDHLNVHHHKVFTNHFIYIDYILDLSHFSRQDLPYVQLLSSLLPHLGMGNRDYRANLEYMHAFTGGISTKTTLYPQILDPTKLRPTFSCRGKALQGNSEKLFALCQDLFLNPNLTESQRISELIIQISTQMRNTINQNALSYAIGLSVAGNSPNSYMNYLWGGLEYYHFIMQQTTDLEKQLPDLLSKLEEIKQRLFHCSSPDLILSCSGDDFDSLKSHAFYDLAKLPSKSFKAWEESYTLKPIPSQAKPISSPVAFTAMGFNTVSYTHLHAPALCIASHLFDNLTLHPLIREQGGAYGGGSSYSPVTGNFYFYGYRDPHIASTLEAFYLAIDNVASGKFTEMDIEESKLGVIQQFDAPIPPGVRANIEYHSLREGKSKENRQEFREKLLATTKKEIVEAVEQSVSPQAKKGTLITFAGESLIKKENDLLAKIRDPLPIIPIK